MNKTYDSNNNPILALNGSLEHTIELKKEILALDQQILAEEKKQEVEANRDKSERIWEQQGKLSSQYKGSPIPGKNNYDKTQAVIYDGDVDAYKKSLEDKKTEYNKYINEMSKIRSEYNEIELKAQQVAITELNKSLEGSKLNDKTLQNINSLAGAFNWGKLSAGETQQVQQGFKNLNNEFGKFNVGNIQKQISNLAIDYEAGSISQDRYAKEIEKLATELNKAGLDIEKGTLIKALQQFRPELQEVQYEIANLLSNHKLKLSDLGTNGMADMLANQLTTIKGLTSKFLSDIEADGTINIKTIPKIGDGLYESLPTQIQGAIDTIMADKKVSEQEAEILMKLMTTWENEGELDEAHLKQLEELDGKQMTTEMKAKLNADVSEDYKKYVINNTKEGQALESTITAKFKAEGQSEYTNAYKQAGVDPNSEEGKKITNKIDAKFEQQGFETSANVADVMNKLGLTSEKQQSQFLSTIKAQIETGDLSLGRLQDSRDILSWLEEHPDIAKKVGLTVDENGNVKEISEYMDKFQKMPDNFNKNLNVNSNTGDIDKVAQQLDGLPVDKQIKLQVSKGLAEADVNGLLNSISKLPPDVQIAILSQTQSFWSKFNEVDKAKIKNKIAELKAKDNATPKVNNINKKKLKDKNTNLKAKDNASGTIDSINNKKLNNKTMTITTVYKTIKNTVSNVWDKLIGKRPKIIEAPATSSDSMQTRDIQPMSNESMVAPLNRSSTGTTTSSDSTTSGTPQITPRYSNNFGGILTTPSLATKLQTSYSTILNMLKYGINIFQELENRINKVNNQIKLLDLQMENSVGVKKIKELETQNKLYTQQCNLQKDLFNVLENQRRAMQGKAKSYGFSIDKHGNLTNYEETLERLETAYENAKKKEDNYAGSNESTKKKLAKATENANKKLSEAKEFSSEYLDLFYNKIPGAEQEWQKLQNTIKENSDTIEQLKFEDKIYAEKHAIEELNSVYDRYSDLLDNVSTIKKRYNGKMQLEYMKQEVSYIKELISVQEKLKAQYSQESRDYRNQLYKYGVKFDWSGNISNYDDVLNRYQNSSDYEKVKKWVDEYNELIAKERDASNSIEDFTNNIQELNNEIKILELAEKVQNATSSIGNANQQMDRLNDKLSLLEVKLKNASGIDKVNLLDEQIKIWQQLSKYQSDTLSQMMSALNVYRNELNNYGFKFDEFGNISNLESALNALKDSADYEYIKDTLDKWKELYNEEIPSAEESILEYKNAIKDANNTKLETTKSVEEKITDMIKDQLEKRKDAIKKQADEEVKLINKKKEEYNALREEMNYKDDYDEQMKKINKLKQQLEIAQRDDSLSSKNKVQELLEQLEEENKKLQEMVQEKIDKDINDMLDKESEKIQEESDKKIENLEDEWTEDKIANAVENAINSGKFTDLEGNIVDLKSAMIEFAEESGEAFGVLGEKIKQEICDNLVIAQDVMKDLSTIYKELEISTPKLTSSIQGLSNNKSRQVTVGDTYFSISSEVNADMIKNIEKMIDRKNEQLIKDIESKI